MLNKTNAASPKKLARFAETHSASLETSWHELKAPGRGVDYDVVRGLSGRGAATTNALGAAAMLADLARVYVDSKRSQYTEAACLLSDEFGSFMLSSQDGGLLRRSKYWKTYVGGGLGGIDEALTRQQFDALRADAKRECGYLDWKGDLVPGSRDPWPVTYEEVPVY